MRFQISKVLYECEILLFTFWFSIKVYLPTYSNSDLKYFLRLKSENVKI